jgi:hypothetical protein
MSPIFAQMLPSYRGEDDKRSRRRPLIRPLTIVLLVLAIFALLQLSSFWTISHHESDVRPAEREERAPRKDTENRIYSFARFLALFVFIEPTAILQP